MAPSRGPLPSPNYLYSRLIHRHRHLPNPNPHLTHPFSTTPHPPSGHNRWSKIRHDKARADSAKNTTRTLHARDLALASRLHGGPDPASNPRLADAIAKAKRAGYPKASILAAIARGQGRSGTGAALENVLFEGVLAGNVGVVVDCETDGRARTLGAVRLWVKEGGGKEGPVGYLFGRWGRVRFRGREGVGVEEGLEVAAEAGAVDVEVAEEGDGEVGGGLVVWTEPENTKSVGEAVATALGLEIQSSEIVWCAKEETKVALANDDAAEELASLVDDLHEREASVQSVAMNVAQGGVSDGAWRALMSRINV